jgi:hypothetical protein
VQINLIAQSKALRQEREALILEAACLAGHIELMKKNAIELEQQITLVNSQTNTFREHKRRAYVTTYVYSG